MRFLLLSYTNHSASSCGAALKEEEGATVIIREKKLLITAVTPSFCFNVGVGHVSRENLLGRAPHYDSIVLAIAALSQLLLLLGFPLVPVLLLLLYPLCSSAGWFAFPWFTIMAVSALEDCANGSSCSEEGKPE